MQVNKKDYDENIRKILDSHSYKSDECVDALSDFILNEIKEAKSNERLRCMDLFGEIVWQQERLTHMLPQNTRKEVFAALSKLVEDYFAACRADHHEEDTRWKMKYILLSEKQQMTAEFNEASSEADGLAGGQKSFGDLVKSKRADAGLRDTAMTIGVSASTLSRVERGCMASAESFYKIFQWLGFTQIFALGNAIYKEKTPRQNHELDGC